MPTYDYVCASCSHRFEIFEKMSARGTRECPKCGRKQARRAVGVGGGFILKGSGFYGTDYKNGPKPPASTPAKKETPAPKPPTTSS